MTDTRYCGKDLGGVRCGDPGGEHTRGLPYACKACQAKPAIRSLMERPGVLPGHDLSPSGKHDPVWCRGCLAGRTSDVLARLVDAINRDDGDDIRSLCEAAEVVLPIAASALDRVRALGDEPATPQGVPASICTAHYCYWPECSPLGCTEPTNRTEDSVLSRIRSSVKWGWGHRLSNDDGRALIGAVDRLRADRDYCAKQMDRLRAERDTWNAAQLSMREEADRLRAELEEANQSRARLAADVVRAHMRSETAEAALAEALQRARHIEAETTRVCIAKDELATALSESVRREDVVRWLFSENHGDMVIGFCRRFPYRDLTMDAGTAETKGGE